MKKINKKLLFSCPTVFLKRPIAEIISKMENNNIGLLSPIDIVEGPLKIHYNKINGINFHNYFTLQLPISSEWPIPLNPIKILKILKKIRKYDVIHMWVPFYLSHVIIILLKQLLFRRKKLIITMDTFPGLSFETGLISNFLFWLFYNLVAKLFFKNVDYLVLYSNSFKKFALDVGVEEEKIRILPTGVDTTLKNKSKNIRNEFTIDENDKVILFVGLLNHRKGVDIFIDVADKLRNKKNLKFLIVGNGSDAKNYKEMVEDKELTQRVIFTGYRNDVHNFYYASDILLFPSRGEGLSGVLMESMSYGLPIVTSKIVGTVDLIDDNYNGFLCEINDIDCYVRKIRTLINKEDIRKRFINNSYERIEKYFNWKINIEKYKKFYKEIIIEDLK